MTVEEKILEAFQKIIGDEFNAVVNAHIEKDIQNEHSDCMRGISASLHCIQE